MPIQHFFVYFACVSKLPLLHHHRASTERLRKSIWQGASSEGEGGYARGGRAYRDAT
jgi:hypothetical protein